MFPSYASLVRPLLEYGAAVWDPYLQRPSLEHCKQFTRLEVILDQALALKLPKYFPTPLLSYPPSFSLQLSFYQM